MINYVLDTNFISSLSILSDSNHKRALQIIEEIDYACNMIIPVTVIMELEAAKQSDVIDLSLHIDDFLEDMVDEIVYVDRDFFQNFQTLSRKVKLNIKAMDLSVLACALIKNATLLTFDKKVIRAANLLNIPTNKD